MNRIFRKLSLTVSCISGMLVFNNSATAQTPTMPDRTLQSIQSKISEDLQLIAGKVVIKGELATIDSLNMMRLLEMEELEFPASDLYDSWNDEYVNPYRQVEFPDSFLVNLEGFSMPFEGLVTSKYGPRKRRFHYGTDIKLQVGDTVRAAFDGKVRVKQYERRGYGYYLVLRHPNALETVYGHLSEFLVEADDTVKSGQPIALGGNTGRSTGSHLHFEMRFLGRAIDPADMVDFDNFVAHTDTYMFNKQTSGVVKNKYTQGGIAYHRVTNGDTLGKIARLHGVTVNQLCRLNNIKSTATLRVGQRLRCS